MHASFYLSQLRLQVMMKKLGLYMNPGDGQNSYANNSGLQKVVILKTRSILDETLKDMMTKFAHNKNNFPTSMKIVDIGCGSGPNAISALDHVMDTIEKLCNNELPEFEVFLNDLSDNDFNNLFKLISSFYDQDNKKNRRSNSFISGLPGSFYGRLFPARSLHFAYSSYSLHWLSQIPEGLEKNNKENIFMAMTSPPQVFEAYAKQYRHDFSRFLRFRGEEIVTGGSMVLTFLGRSPVDPSSYRSDVFALLSKTLVDMVAMGLVDKEDLYSFNVPIYMPCQQEVEAIITDEGSFNLDKMEVFAVPWDANGNEDDLVFDKDRSGKFVADIIRAITEPMLSSHFGSSININDVFDRYAKNMAHHLSIERSTYFSIAISLSRR